VLIVVLSVAGVLENWVDDEAVVVVDDSGKKVVHVE
jgi:hypothetical protein